MRQKLNVRARLGVVAVALLAACSRQPAAPQLHVPPQIVVPAGAYDIGSRELVDGTVGVGYRLHEPFPADGLLARVRGALPAPAWQPLERDWLHPDSPSSHQRGWSDFTDGTKSPSTRVHAWSAQWRDAQGNVVIYYLRYDSAVHPESVNPPDNDKLFVAAAWYPKVEADKLMKQASSASRNPSDYK
jgi:hypothetical protein